MSGIHSAASAMQQAVVRAEISFAVAGKRLDAQRLQGEAVVQLLDQAAQLAQQAHPAGGNGTYVDALA
jgi:hypothetical protein